MKGKYPGFTIIEIIIVASVLGVLGSILLFKYPSSLRTSRNIERQSDLKSYRNGLELYANTNSGMYPLKTDPVDITSLCTDLQMPGAACADDPSGGTYNYETDATGKNYVAWTGKEGSSSYIAYCSNGNSGDTSSEPADGNCPAFAVSEPYGIVLNEHQGRCSDVCTSNGYSGCQSIGMDVEASNGRYYLFFGCALSVSGSCNTPMFNFLWSCQGHQAMWTYCRCLGTGG